MARDMNCEPQLIMQRDIGEFACFVRAMTKSPFIVKAPIGQINAVPKCSESDFGFIVQLSRDIYGISSTSHSARIGEQQKQESVQIRTVEKNEEKKDPSAPAPWGKV